MVVTVVILVIEVIVVIVVILVIVHSHWSYCSHCSHCLIGSDRPTDRQTMSVIEQSWTVNNLPVLDGGTFCISVEYENCSLPQISSFYCDQQG